MAVMQKVREAWYGGDQNVYACLSCRCHTCEPLNYCNNCGMKITKINVDLMQKSNTVKRDKKAKRCKAKKNKIPTGFYILYKMPCNPDYKLAGQFFDEYSRDKFSFAKRLHKFIKENIINDDFISSKIVILKPEDVKKYEVWGTNLTEYFV